MGLPFCLSKISQIQLRIWMRDVVHLPAFSAETEHDHEQDIVECDEDGTHDHDVLAREVKGNAS